MSVQSSALLISKEGYYEALTVEKTGLAFEITRFHVAENSMAGAGLVLPWGNIVFEGPVNDYTVLENTLVFTLVVPPDVKTCTIDTIALYSASGTIVAQGFLKLSRAKKFSSSMYVYCYLNAPEPTDLVEFRPTIPGPVPTVRDYADLPLAQTSARFEYIVQNGHGTKTGDFKGLAYTPTMVILSSLPKTAVYPPFEPFSDPSVGTLSAGIYEHYVSAVNGLGESLPSAPHVTVLAPLASPVAYISLSQGNSPSGANYFQVVAKANGGGLTLGSTEISATVVRLSTPVINSQSSVPGGLAAGTYGYRLSAVSAYGETLASTAVSIVQGADSGTLLAWTAVTNAVAYKLYRLDPGGAAYYFAYDIAGAATSFIDWGQVVDESRTVLTVAQDGGVYINWDKVDDADSYQIYGRVTGGSKLLIDEVDGQTFNWRDTGATAISPTLPSANNTNSGIKIKWDAVPEALTYNVYGRTVGSKGLLVNTAFLTYTDTGSVSPGAAAPTENTSAAMEWQALDGVLVARTTVASSTSKGFIATATISTTNGLDLGFVNILSGAHKGKSRHVEYDTDTNTFSFVDKEITIAPGVSIVIWGYNGQCGGKCPGISGFAPTNLVPELPAVQNFAYLGVHFCGVFMGNPVTQQANVTDSNYNWTSLTNPGEINSGRLEFAFCDAFGYSQFNTPIDNVVKTPKGNRLPIGDYANFSAIGHAIQYTLDSILVPPGIRLVIYTSPNFANDTIAMDVEGPAYIVNYVWFEDPRFAWALDDYMFTGVLDSMIPKVKRVRSTIDLNTLRGSIQVLPS